MGGEGVGQGAEGEKPPLLEEVHRYDFFQAVRLLLGRLGGVRPGGRGPLSGERLRFRASTGLGFPRSDLEAVRWIEDGDGPPRAELVTRFLGLTGATTPLPVTYAEETLLEEESSPQIRDFLDLFHHRLISLLYRAWLRHRHAFAYEEGGTDPLSRMLLEFLDVSADAPALESGLEPHRLLRHLGLLLMPSRPPAGLEAILSAELGLPVRLEPLAPRTVEVPPAQRYRVGRHQARGAGLGKGIVVGRRMRDCAGCIRLEIGPVSYARLKQLEPGGEDHRRLVAFTRFYVRKPLEIEVRVLVPAVEMARYRAGGPGRTRLRRNATLGRPQQDPVPVTFRIKPS